MGQVIGGARSILPKSQFSTVDAPPGSPWLKSVAQT